MPIRKTVCQLASTVLILPGAVCLFALFVPALHGTAFWAFSSQHWWQLFFAGSVLSLASLFACHLINRG
jgi:hypothetical protein